MISEIIADSVQLPGSALPNVHGAGDRWVHASLEACTPSCVCLVTRTAHGARASKGMSVPGCTRLYARA